jgi:hypothetical protein
MDTPKYRNCDICGKTYKDDHVYLPELCTSCWYIPNHIPKAQYGRWYDKLYENIGSKRGK